MSGTTRFKFCLLLVLSLVIPAGKQTLVTAQTSDRLDQMRFLPDVVGQFNALSFGADPLGFRITGSPDPSSCKHYQGVVRVQGSDGTSYLLVTRSGNVPDVPGPGGSGCNDSDGETDNGHLIVVRMGSREKHGERMRSNRLQKGVHVDSTAPPPEDKVTAFFTVVNEGLVPGDATGNDPGIYQHPGGMQLIGNVLALAVEHRRTIPPGWVPGDPPYDIAPHPTLAMFFDVSNPENPRFLSQSPLKDAQNEVLNVAGTVGITPLPDDYYLMAVTGGKHNPVVYFYRSSSTKLDDPTLEWALVDEWRADTSQDFPPYYSCASGSVVGPNQNCLSPDEQYLDQNWPDGNDGYTHQTLQFLREGNIDGTLYLAGARGKYGEDPTKIDLYRVDCEGANCDGGQILLKRIQTRDLAPYPSTGGEKLASLAAASTFYVSPSGELLFYATEHDNDGPYATAKAGEWRHVNMVRENSPTLFPTAIVNGTYEVDEGGSVTLSGSAKPPMAKPWIQLFWDTGFGGLYPVIDFDDYGLDDFDDFTKLPVHHFFAEPNHADKASSWRWYAPVGCSIRAIDHHQGTIDETRTLPGTSMAEQAADLTLVPNDGDSDNVNQEIDAVEFLADCEQYYATQLTLQWDLDLDGSYETTGSEVTLNAGTFDGPSVVNIPAQAAHPAGGNTGPATAMVTVRNVAPTVTSLSLVDSLGRTVGSDVPFAFANLECFVQSSFTDPGKPDHQTAVLNLGDGTSVPSSAFDQFNDAYGGSTGQLRQRHIYTTPGTYTIRVDVTDDDGGQTSAEMTVRVVSPVDAVRSVIEQIDLLLVAATNSNVVKALHNARDDLAGDDRGLFREGALDKLEEGKLVAALVKIKEAIEALQRAEVAGGGNLGGLKYSLGLTSEAIAQGAYLHALASVGSPNPGEAVQLEKIRESIAAGHARLVAGAYVAAVDHFKEAAARAACLEAFLCIYIEI